MFKSKYKDVCTERDRETDRQTQRQTDRQTDRQREREREERERHTHTHKHARIDREREREKLCVCVCAWCAKYHQQPNDKDQNTARHTKVNIKEAQLSPGFRLSILKLLIANTLITTEGDKHDSVSQFETKIYTKHYIKSPPKRKLALHRSFTET